MQLLYGNDGTNYRTIAKSTDITAKQEKRLLAVYSGYDYVSNTEDYSSVEKQPVALSYVTTDLDHALNTEMILLVQTAKMSNYSSPCYYSHFHLIEKTKELYGKKFFSLLQVPFIKDVDLKDYQKKNIDSFEINKESLPPVRRDAIEEPKILPLVAAILNVVDDMSERVNLVLDRKGDEYNQRALEVIAGLYVYLPYNIRKEAGFTTYAGKGGRISGRIKLCMYTREALDSLGNETIDLATINPEEIFKKIPPHIVQFAKEIVGESAEEREELFRVFQSVFGANYATVEEHIAFYKSFGKWHNDDLKSIIDRLATYVYEEMQRKKRIPMLKGFQEILSAKFGEEEFIGCYQEMMATLLDERKSFGFDDILKKYILLGDSLDNVKFNIPKFVEWMQETIIAKTDRQFKDQELYKWLSECKESLRNVLSVKGKHLQIVKAMDQTLEKEMQLIGKDVVKTEARNIEKYFNDVRFDALMNKDIKKLYMDIDHNENQDIFRRELCQKCESVLTDGINFTNYEFCEKISKFLEMNKCYFGERDYQRFSIMLSKKQKTVKFMEEGKIHEWEGRQDVFLSCPKISSMRTVSEIDNIEISECLLRINGNEYVLKEKELRGLIENILCYDNVRKAEFVFFLQERRKLAEDLIEIKVFGEEHFELLMEMGESSDRRRVLEYYLKEKIMLSEEVVKQQIKGLDKGIRWKLEKGNLPNNILGITLKKITDTKAGKILIRPATVMTSTFLPSVVFGMVLIYKETFNSNGAIPLALIAMSGLIFLFCAILQFRMTNSNDGKYLGGILGGFMSVIAVCLAWILP